MKQLSPSLKLSLIYFSAGVVWILLSDIVANLFFNADNALLTLNIAKGLLFVILTSFILFFISKYYHNQIKAETLQKVLTEEELAKKSLLLNQVADTSPVAITIVDLNGAITYANKAAEELLMLSLTSIKERKFDAPEWKITTIEGADFPKENLPVNQVLRTKKSVKDVRHAIELPSGRLSYLSINAAPLFEEDEGELLGVVAIMKDITHTVKYEKRLLESRVTYRGILDSIEEAIFIHDFNKKILDANKKAETMFEYSLPELVGKTPYDLGAPDKNDFKEIESIIDEAIAGKMKKLVFWSKKSTGEVFPTEVNLVLGKYFGKDVVIAVARDISERFKMEEELKKNERNYRRVFENIIDVYYETKLNGEILEVSPSIKYLSYGNYTREDLIGKNIAEFYYDKTEREQFVQLLLNQQRVDDFEIRIQNKDERIIHCSATAKIIEEGDEKRIVGTLHDITVRKEYEEDLISAKEAAEKANQLKTDFLAQISHEIRTPLNIILNSTQLIQEELTEEQAVELSEIYSILKSSGARITRTVESILNMSELQTGSYEPQFRDIKLIGNILKDLVGEYKLLAEQKGIELKLNTYNLDEVLIYADGYSVTQVFANLIDNAVKYTDKGNISISVEEVNGNAIVKVSDSGIGIEDGFLTELFEPFRQEQQGYSREYEGNGLGLALVKKFCELNKMRIDVKSKRNEGSTFTVRIPCEQSISQN